MIISTKEFESLQLSERVNYVDSFYSIELLSETSEREVKKLLRSIVEDDGENNYVRRKALLNMCEMTLVGKLLIPGTMDVLLDMAQEHDPFLVVLAIKYLFIFKGNYETEVFSILEELADKNDVEVVSEACFRLGLIYFFKSTEDGEVELFVKNILKAIKLFSESFDSTENRADAEYYYWVSDFVLNVVKSDIHEAKNSYQELVSKLWSKQIYGLHENVSKFDYKLYEVINRIFKIANNNIQEWLDYRESILELSNLHYELLNANLSENLYESGLLDTFKDLSVNNILYPFYRNSFQASMSAIKRLQAEYSDSDEKDVTVFLNTLVELSVKNHKKKECDLNILVRLAQLFPTIDPAQIEEDAKSIDFKRFPELLVKMFEKYSAETESITGMCITGSRQGDEIFNTISDNLKVKLKTYPVKKMYEFQGVLSDIIRYVHLSTQAKNNFSGFLKFLFNKNAEEKDLQDSLMAFLRMNTSRGSSYRAEVSDVADGGRVDILFEIDGLTVPIELKKTSSIINEKHIKECYLSQAQTYVYPYDQLGIFVLLDVGEKYTHCPINNIRDLFDVMHLEPSYDLNQCHPDYVVTVIVPANKMLPSARSTYK